MSLCKNYKVVQTSLLNINVSRGLIIIVGEKGITIDYIFITNTYLNLYYISLKV